MGIGFQSRVRDGKEVGRGELGIITFVLICFLKIFRGASSNNIKYILIFKKKIFILGRFPSGQSSSSRLRRSTSGPVDGRHPEGLRLQARLQESRLLLQSRKPVHI